MSTMKGSIWTQNIGWRFNNNAGVDTVNFKFNNRDITAEAAISLITRGKKNIWAGCSFVKSFSLSLFCLNVGAI